MDTSRVQLSFKCIPVLLKRIREAFLRYRENEMKHFPPFGSYNVEDKQAGNISSQQH